MRFAQCVRALMAVAAMGMLLTGAGWARTSGQAQGSGTPVPAKQESPSTDDQRTFRAMVAEVKRDIQDRKFDQARAAAKKAKAFAGSRSLGAEAIAEADKLPGAIDAAEEKIFNDAKAKAGSSDRHELVAAKKVFDLLAAGSGRHAAESRKLSAQVAERIKMLAGALVEPRRTPEPGAIPNIPRPEEQTKGPRVVCAVSPVVHQDWKAAVKPEMEIGQAYLDEPVELKAGENCGLDEGLMQSAAGGEFRLLVSIEPQGTVADCILVMGDVAIGANVQAAARRGWQFTPPKVHGTAVSTQVVVAVRIRQKQS